MTHISELLADLEVFYVEGRGIVWSGTLTEDRTDKPLFGLMFENEGKMHRVVAVEVFAVPRPLRKGARVGLVLTEVNA